MIDVQIQAADIQRYARRLLQVPDVENAMAEDVAKTFRNLIIGATPVGKEEGGTLKRSWSEVQHEAGGFSFSNETPYGYVLEEGRYKGVGPRTVMYNDKIYSRQAPGGIMTPIVSDPRVMQRVVNQAIRQLAKAIPNA